MAHQLPAARVTAPACTLFAAQPSHVLRCGSSVPDPTSRPAGTRHGGATPR